MIVQLKNLLITGITSPSEPKDFMLIFLLVISLCLLAMLAKAVIELESIKKSNAPRYKDEMEQTRKINEQLVTDRIGLVNVLKKYDRLYNNPYIKGRHVYDNRCSCDHCILKGYYNDVINTNQKYKSYGEEKQKN